MTTEETRDFPDQTASETELYLRWLGFLRGAVLRKASGLSDDQARWTPQVRLISLLGIVNHLTHVERLWIDGWMYGHQASRSEDQFSPGSSPGISTALAAYRHRRTPTDHEIRLLQP